MEVSSGFFGSIQTRFFFSKSRSSTGFKKILLVTHKTLALCYCAEFVENAL